MPRFLIICAVALLAGTGSARAAATAETGTELLAQCDSASTGAATSTPAVSCVAYLVGIFDALRAFSGGTRDPLICPPPGLTDQQFAQAFQTWARYNPQRLAAYPAAGAMESIIQAFPCRRNAAPPAPPARQNR